MKNLLLFLCCLSCTLSVAQRKYSYIDDRRFFGPEMLIGYDFRPSEVEIPDELKKTLRPGEYSFGVTQRYLYVEGPEIRGVYDVNNINSTEYGFILTTINARDARLQGHLKVILNKRSQAEAVIFRRSPEEQEMIFFLPLCPDELFYAERDFFTDRKEVYVYHPDSLWGMELKPFWRIHQKENVQERLQMADSTYISFIEEIIIDEKIKTSKEKIQLQVEPEEPGKEIILKDSTIIDTAILTTETRNYYVQERSILQYDDGTSEDKTTRYQIKKVTERQNTNAAPWEDHYKMTLTTTDGEDIFIYLTQARTFSGIEIRDKKYLARGH